MTKPQLISNLTVGTFAVQLAKGTGAYVIAHVKGDKADFVKQIGADEFVNADNQRFESAR
jgi:NADPH:quinone reductase-like Zn-dependent oxidoreductase